jgi:hypothetical protein
VRLGRSIARDGDDVRERMRERARVSTPREVRFDAVAMILADAM